MTKNQYFALQVLLLVIGVATMIYLLIFQFSNPELTGAQVLISKWQYYTGIFVVFIISQVLMYFRKKLLK